MSNSIIKFSIFFSLFTMIRIGEDFLFYELFIYIFKTIPFYLISLIYFTYISAKAIKSITLFLQNLNKSTENNVDYYLILNEIGRGNFSKVKLALNISDEKYYAVKIINKDKLDKRKYKEIDFISRLNHINVAFLYDLIEDEKYYYFITEYCRKGELFNYITNKGKLSEEESSIFFYQLINGIEFIHSKNIAHRDLKPENVLLTEDDTLKIIDFGLAHEYFKDNSILLKSSCGSPYYGAPEVIMLLPYNGFKADLWCSGIILYNMLTGSFPFFSEEQNDLFQKICFSDVEYQEFLSEDSVDLLKKILNKNPVNRISIDEIKKHNFYLKGKTLCNLNYNKLEENFINKRINKYIVKKKKRNENLLNFIQFCFNIFLYAFSFYQINISLNFFSRND